MDEMNQNRSQDLGQRFMDVNASQMLNRDYAFIESLSAGNPLLQQPQLFFFPSKTSLHCLVGKHSFPIYRALKPDEQKTFAEICHVSPENVTELLPALFHVLSLGQYPRHFRIFAQFKWQCMLRSFPLLDDFAMGIPGNFSLMDNRLYVNTADKEWHPMTDDVMKKLVKNAGGAYAASDEMKKRVAKEIRHLCDENEVEEQSKDILTIDYAKSRMTYYPTLQKAVCRKKAVWKHATPLHISLPVSIPYTPSEELKELLASMTDYDKTRLDTLAEITSRLLSYPCPSEKLWVLYGKGAHAWFYFFYQICAGRVSSSVYENTPNSQMLVRDDAYHVRMQVNKSFLSPEKLATLNHSFLQRLINGTNVISKPDPFSPDLGRSYSPVIFFVTPYEIAKPQRYFKRIPHSLLYADTICIPEIPPSDLVWLQTVFAAHGMFVISNASNDSSEEDVPDTFALLLENFIARHTKKSDGAVPCQDFIAAFIQYVRAQGADFPELGKPTLLAKKIAALAYLERASVRKFGNRQCFLRIELYIDSLPEPKNENDVPSSPSKTDFLDYIESMRSRIEKRPPNELFLP